ncbi:MAG TPA: histidine phosphatase family protein [Candidatus Poseidoniales archaeon]|nr:MAG TPA: histidine phosphatase family protein [Candidatus Poseidoniales archaeon]
MATRLIVMRHAKSSFLDGQQEDFERPLNEQGQKDAIMIGNQLLNLGWKPDIVMVSPSMRTMETLNLMGEEFIKTKCVTNSELYLADLYTLEDCVNKAPDDATTLLLGHNPGIEILVSSLSGQYRIMKEAYTALFKKSTENWMLEYILTPR